MISVVLIWLLLCYSNANTSTSVHLFGQFKQNSLDSNNLTASRFDRMTSQEKSDDLSSPSTYFTSALSRISPRATTSGFGSPSISLAASFTPLEAK